MLILLIRLILGRTESRTTLSGGELSTVACDATSASLFGEFEESWLLSLTDLSCEVRALIFGSL